jgi:hypothetical protein
MLLWKQSQPDSSFIILFSLLNKLSKRLKRVGLSGGHTSGIPPAGHPEFSARQRPDPQKYYKNL